MREAGLLAGLVVVGEQGDLCERLDDHVPFQKCTGFRNPIILHKQDVRIDPDDLVAIGRKVCECDGEETLLLPEDASGSHPDDLFRVIIRKLEWFSLHGCLDDDELQPLTLGCCAECPVVRQPITVGGGIEVRGDAEDRSGERFGKLRRVYERRRARFLLPCLQRSQRMHMQGSIVKGGCRFVTVDSREECCDGEWWSDLYDFRTDISDTYVRLRTSLLCSN